MSKDLATALRSGKGQFTVHRQQLRATQEFLIEKLQSSAPMKSKDKSVFPIMEFPYDVRHLVLENMIEAQTLRVFLKHAAIPIALPHVARAGSSLLRRECLLVALKMSTIEVHSGPGNVALQAWLARIDFSGVETDSGNCQNGFDAINALSFPYFSRFPYDRPGITTNHDIQLALACKHLRTLTLNFQPEEVSRIESKFLPWTMNEGSDEVDEHRVVRIPAAARVRQNYQLDRLLGAKQLQKIRFSAMETCTLKVLSTWFVEEFSARGQKVMITFA